MNPLVQHADGRVFASYLNGNNKQRFFVEIHLHDTWYPHPRTLPWPVYIGCNQGHSSGVVQPEHISHPLTACECFSLGWIFHATDAHYRNSIFSQGLKRRKRDSLHVLYENGGSGNKRTQKV